MKHCKNCGHRIVKINNSSLYFHFFTKTIDYISEDLISHDCDCKGCGCKNPEFEEGVEQNGK